MFRQSFLLVVVCLILEQTSADSSSFPTCPWSSSTTFLAHETDCALYYLCQDGELTLFTCPTDTLFDSGTSACMESSKVTCRGCGHARTDLCPPTPTCSVEEAGLTKPYPPDCTKFLYCTVQGTSQLRVCINGNHFSPTLNYCTTPAEANCPFCIVPTTTTNPPTTTTVLTTTTTTKAPTTTTLAPTTTTVPTTTTTKAPTTTTKAPTTTTLAPTTTTTMTTTIAPTTTTLAPTTTTTTTTTIAPTTTTLAPTTTTTTTTTIAPTTTTLAPTTTTTTTTTAPTTTTTTTTTKAPTTTTKAPTTTTKAPTTTTVAPTTTTTTTTTTKAPTTTTLAPTTTTTKAPTTTTLAPTTTTLAPTTSTTPMSSSPQGDPICPDMYQCTVADAGRMVPYPPNCHKYVFCTSDGRNDIRACLGDGIFCTERNYCTSPDEAVCPYCEEMTTPTVGICPPTPECTYDDNGYFLPYPPDCSMYLYCDEDEGAVLSYCPMGMLFSPDTRKCVQPEIANCPFCMEYVSTTTPTPETCDEIPRCGVDERGLNKPFPPDCTKYIHCAEGGIGIFSSCESNGHFSPDEQMCMEPELANCPSCVEVPTPPYEICPEVPTCRIEDAGYLKPYPPDCQLYIYCNDDAEPELSYCPSGQEFSTRFRTCMDANIASCRKCSESSTSETTEETSTVSPTTTLAPTTTTVAPTTTTTLPPTTTTTLAPTTSTTTTLPPTTTTTLAPTTSTTTTLPPTTTTTLAPTTTTLAPTTSTTTTLPPTTTTTLAPTTTTLAPTTTTTTLAPTTTTTLTPTTSTTTLPPTTTTTLAPTTTTLAPTTITTTTLEPTTTTTTTLPPTTTLPTCTPTPTCSRNEIMNEINNGNQLRLPFPPDCRIYIRCKGHNKEEYWICPTGKEFSPTQAWCMFPNEANCPHCDAGNFTLPPTMGSEATWDGTPTPPTNFDQLHELPYELEQYDGEEEEDEYVDVEKYGFRLNDGNF